MAARTRLTYPNDLISSTENYTIQDSNYIVVPIVHEFITIHRKIPNIDKIPSILFFSFCDVKKDIKFCIIIKILNNLTLDNFTTLFTICNNNSLFTQEIYTNYIKLLYQIIKDIYDDIYNYLNSINNAIYEKFFNLDISSLFNNDDDKKFNKYLMKLQKYIDFYLKKYSALHHYNLSMQATNSEIRPSISYEDIYLSIFQNKYYFNNSNNLNNFKILNSLLNKITFTKESFFSKFIKLMSKKNAIAPLPQIVQLGGKNIDIKILIEKLIYYNNINNSNIINDILSLIKTKKKKSNNITNLKELKKIIRLFIKNNDILNKYKNKKLIIQKMKEFIK